MEPQKLTLVAGGEGEARLKRFLRDRVKSIRDGLHELHTTKVIQWRKAYEAVPAEPTREFPWHGASNLVVPLIAIHADTLLARCMSSVFKTRPLWVVRLIAQMQGLPEGLRESLEQYLEYVGMEPDELDLYRVCHEWFGETIRLGTSVVKSPWLKKIEDQYAPAGDFSGNYEYIRKTLYEGPRPEKIGFENFGIPPAARTVEEADFKYDRIKLHRFDLEERAYRGVYDRLAIQEVLKQPDRTGPDYVQTQKEMDAGAHTLPGYEYSSEWDIHECWFRFRIEKDKFVRLIVSYHEKSQQILRAYHHYYPGEIFIASRLFFRDDMFHGYGFCETLAMLQEEISQIHNQRRDNMTVANMKMFRADEDSKLHEGLKVFPSAVLPGKKDELETLEFGTPVQGEIDSERLTLELAEKRSGVSPPMQGAGAGTNTKRGVYSAMGTLSVLQEGNTRTDLNITDVRYAFTRLGRLLCKEYSAFGKDSDFHQQRLMMFGQMGDKAKQALDMLAQGRLALPVHAATSSINREVEKQNDLMLSSIMARHYQMVSQMLQGATNQMMPEQIRQYLTEAIKSADLLMKYILRHFNYDEPDRLVPEPQAPPTGGQQPPTNRMLQAGGIGPSPLMGAQGAQPMPNTPNMPTNVLTSTRPQ